MRWTDYAQAVGSIASAVAVLVAILAGAIGWSAARKTAVQTELFVGAQAAIAWREQVFSLHDRGLSPGQIRFVLHLEDGGAGYEGWYGSLDDLLDGIPVTRSAWWQGRPGPIERPECPRMPTVRGTDPPVRGGCTGPCRDALRLSGCQEFRELDRGAARRRWRRHPDNGIRTTAEHRPAGLS